MRVASAPAAPALPLREGRWAELRRLPNNAGAPRFARARVGPPSARNAAAEGRATSTFLVAESPWYSAAWAAELGQGARRPPVVGEGPLL